MNNLSLDLRAKILFGSLLLVIPLAVALTFVYQYGVDQIRVAEQEDLGIRAAAPLWEAVFAWQTGTDREATLKALEGFTTIMAGEGSSLRPAADATTGATWVTPEALVEGLQTADPADKTQFPKVHQWLVNDILVVADKSGLVLDPELPSYYLILAKYQTVPNMIERVTDLRSLYGLSTQRLGNEERLLLYSRARELQFQANYLVDQVNRSTRAAAESKGGPVPGYAEAMDGLLKTVVSTSEAIEAAAGPPALGEGFSPGIFQSQTQTLVFALRNFQTEAQKALEVMIHRRIAGATAQLQWAFALAGAGLLVGGGILLWVIAGIRRRVFALMASLASLTQNDLTKEIPAHLLGSRDELGRLAKSVKLLQSELKTQVNGIESVVGDLSNIGSNLGATSEQSSAAIEQMSAITATVAHAAGSQSDQTVHANRIVAEMVERIEQSNELTQGMATQFFLFSQSMEANRNRIRETALEAQATGQRAEGLATTGDNGERSLQALTKSIQGVVEKTGEIQEIVQFILDIADRTNLLSMNAAIEAAHAGTAGRGFSIVADEIRKLAEVSSKQAQTIKGLLEGISGVVGKTMKDSEATAKSFQTLRNDIATVRTASHDIAEKMAAQEAEDQTLSAGLQTFAEFYGKLSEALDHQIGESQTVRKALESLENSGREISNSMHEQKIGMEQSTEASIQVRETSLNLSQVIDVLEAQVSRFKT